MRKKILAPLLSLALCLSLLPAALAAGKTYEEAVKEFREEDSMRTVSQIFESDYGTIFIYGSPNPHGSTGSLLFITKAPCAKGEGEVISLPNPRHSIMCDTKGPQTAVLSEDGKTFTYTYHYDEPLTAPQGPTLRPAGDFIYTLDLSKTNTLPTIKPQETPGTIGTQAAELAGKLKALGLFLGDEKGNFNLDKAPSRVEALVMLIRALGEESQAKAAGESHPFSDVPAWADSYVSWGYAKGYTKGVSATEFGVERTASCEMYLTFLLRALGYTEGADGDFTYDKPYYPAYQAGIFPSCVDFTNFRRSDVVEATVAALFAGDKENNKALHTKLTAAGAFTAEDFDQAFPADPYETEKQLNSWIETALDELIGNGRVDYKNLRDHSHVLYSWEETDQGLQARAFAKSAAYTLNPDNSFSSTGSGGHFYQFIFEPKTGQLLSYDGGLPWPDGWDYDAYQQILTGVVDQKMDALFASGMAGYIRPSYEVAVNELRESFGYYNEETFETPDCAIFVFDRGGMMNAPSGSMVLIYKPGSQLGDGTVVDLPYAVVRSGFAVCYPADTMTLSEDGKTFTYTYYREQDLEVQKAGVITYTVDLPTGKVTESYAPHSHAGSMAHVTRRRIVSSNEHSEDRKVVKTLETPECTVVLTKGRFYNETDDYILSLVYKPGSTLGDGTIKRLLLPTTVDLRSWYNPTDRAPDSLTLSEDGKTLTYVYRFDEALENFHEAGTYTYTVDLSTGELRVAHTEN